MTFLAFERALSEARIGHDMTRVIAARKCVSAKLKQIATRLSNIRDYTDACRYIPQNGDALALLEIATEASNLLPALLRRSET